ncbi:MAG TPA: NRDE family protein [Longimicrobiales bacterium]|nr:NRDE family protein [Longimicrobiales bacterium]
MCLILLAHRAHPDFPLVLAANRDEFYARPTAPARYWPDAPHVLGGRDLTAGGTWLGLARDGRWAAVTNYRDPPAARQGRPSRGALVAEFLRNHAAPHDYLDAVSADAGEYDGFNLLVGDLAGAHYLGNRAPDGANRRKLEPGLYGLSNHLLDTPWPKVARGRRLLGELLDAGAPTTDALLGILYDTDVAPDDALPRTGIDAEWERALSASFIATPTYGTRASTALIIDRRGHATFVERTFGPGPRREADVRFDLEMALP